MRGGGWPRRPRPAVLALSAATLAIITVAVSALAAGCSDRTPPRTQLIRIATGSKTAVYYQYGKALATIINRELPGVHAEVLVTSASVRNVQLIRDGEAELAFTQADILDPPPPRDGVAASADSVDTTGVMALARVYDDQLHLVVRAAGPIQKLADLRGRRVSIGAPASGTSITARRLLKLAGLDGRGAVSPVSLNLDNSVAQLRAGDIDAFFFSGGLPVAAVETLAEQVGIQLVDLGEWVPAMRRTYTDVYDVRSVPASVYRMKPVTTIGDPNYLVVPRSLPERVAFELTRILIERREELGRAHPAAEWLDSRTAINTEPVPLHPGAIRFYRDSKE